MAAVAGPTQEATGELSCVPNEIPEVLEGVIRQIARGNIEVRKVAENGIYSHPTLPSNPKED